MQRITDWMLEQFSEERCNRWLDGSRRTKVRYGYRSFVQVLDYAWERKKSGGYRRVPRPNIWSVVQCSAPHGLRWQYYLKVHFHAAQGSNVLAKLEMRSTGIYARVPARKVESEVEFDPHENAPRKLNREIRRLRELLLAP